MADWVPCRLFHVKAASRTGAMKWMERESRFLANTDGGSFALDQVAIFTWNRPQTSAVYASF